MSVLQTFMRRLEATYSDQQWSRVREREAERMGIEAPEWAALRSMNIDLVSVREAHRSVTKRTVVRRADRHGEWVLGSAQPGRLRSQPQSFRVDDRIEPAWEHATLRHRLAALVNTTREGAVSAPVPAIARFLRDFARAQPFSGQNENVSLVVASAILRLNALPALHVRHLVHDREFELALIADDGLAMEQFLEAALWAEALSFSEWMSPPPSQSRWTLADDHDAASASRSSVDLQAIADEMTPLLPPARRLVHETFAARLRAAGDAVHRGHCISPHHSIVELRWEQGHFEGVLVIALAGRGMTGAASAHLSIEHPDVVRPGVTPAVLLPLDESAPDRGARIAVWLSNALIACR